MAGVSQPGHSMMEPLADYASNNCYEHQVLSSLPDTPMAQDEEDVSRTATCPIYAKEEGNQ
jgi:hypothetical protein